MLLTVQIMITILCLGMLLNGVLNGRRIRRDRELMLRQPLPPEPPLITVCVPARNEARNIADCVGSLIRQNYPNFEVLVLDDCSEDDTGEIARRTAAGNPRVRVLEGEPLEPGWIGKPHACRQLAEAACGEWLLFTDADTVFKPWALERTLRLALARRSDLLSGLPSMQVETIWERLSVPMLGLIGVGVANFKLVETLPFPWYGGASGAFLFFRREAYDAIGGHHTVRGHIVEDIELARAIKRKGRRLVMTDVTRLVSCRMYTTLREVWEGLTKNFYACFPGGLFGIMILGLLGLFVVPWVSFLFGPLWGWNPICATVLPLAQILPISFLKAMVDRRMGAPGFWPNLWGILLIPFSALFMAVIALRSGSRALFRQSTPWRARHYELWKD